MILTKITEMEKVNLDIISYQDGNSLVYDKVDHVPVVFDSEDISILPINITICCGCTWKCVSTE